MLSTSVPGKFPIWWASSADPAYVRTVPENSQIGIQDGAASLHDGFPPLTFQQLAAGGSPPFGQDFNGILRLVTMIQQWQQAGGGWVYDSSFATSISGYPKGAILNSAILSGAQWYSTVDGNTSNPDDPLTSSGWLRVGLPPGSIVPFIGAVPSGYVSLNANASPFTIGSAASGAGYAAADALFLYAHNWANPFLTIYTSGGVLTSRGANAVADFIANKRLAVPDLRGSSLMGVDNGSTFLSGVPFTSGATTSFGSLLGENLHTLTLAEIVSHFHGAPIFDPTHFHTYQVANTSAAGATGGGNANSLNLTNPTIAASTSSNATGVRVNGTGGLDNTSNAGGGGSHNTVQRSLSCNWSQKL